MLLLIFVEIKRQYTCFNIYHHEKVKLQHFGTDFLENISSRMMSKIKRENNFQCHFSRGQQLCANIRYDGNQEFEVISIFHAFS